MSLLGRLLVNRRAGETHTAWNLPNLQGPDELTLTSGQFGDGDAMPVAHAEKYAGGDNLSPHLAWTPPPSGTQQLLLVVEDIDVPVGKPAVHCLALVDPDVGHLEAGGLNTGQPAPGVRLLKSTIGRGYHGPAPVKGHGPHHYTFQLFALAAPVDSGSAATSVDRARPRTLLPAITAPVLARGRLTGVYER
ncbi:MULTISPECIES: YbhB/YbcL family Raf kinase inhibitor-like protein [unclassified Streptomyces]|uniref:YbhB/YbcL family Raf kinase inhibitor-like protein n=1 Tax=unclassified Streptomyces TaxID=2593676 RepID=UPI00324ED0C5